MSDQIGVIGAGAWGTTLAVLLADAQRPVSLRAHTVEAGERLAQARTNERYLPGVVFPPNVRVVTDDAYLSEPHRFYVLAVRRRTCGGRSRSSGHCWIPMPRSCPSRRGSKRARTCG